MTDIAKIAAGLSEAQKRYLRELEPNKLDGLDGITREIQRGFQNRAFRTPIKGAKLASAHAARMKKIVVQRGAEHPVECGWHYASLTPLGLAVREYLENQHD